MFGVVCTIAVRRWAKYAANEETRTPPRVCVSERGRTMDTNRAGMCEKLCVAHDCVTVGPNVRNIHLASIICHTPYTHTRTDHASQLNDCCRCVCESLPSSLTEIDFPRVRWSFLCFMFFIYFFFLVLHFWDAHAIRIISVQFSHSYSVYVAVCGG